MPHLQFYMMKDMAVRYREYSHFQCRDDKAIIPVGEPGKPVSTGVRAHHRGLTINNSSGLQCLDHDYHLASIVASVAFSVAIPDHPRDSFYKGTVHVTVKDKVFQASSPLRHAAENRNIIIEHYTVDGISLEQLILFRYTDGGPDHRTTYKSVKMACLLEFISLDLDLLVCVRTAPNQSYNNPAERIMSLLNLGLQNVALSRSSMSEGFEFQVKRLTYLKAIRNYAEKNKPFKEAYQISMADTCTIVSERFKRLQLKEDSLKVHTPASDAELDQLCSMAKLIDSSFDPKNIGNFETSEKVKKFFESHSMARQYSFQVGISCIICFHCLVIELSKMSIKFQLKKCKGNCPYCILNPPRLPGDVFEGLHFLPDPVSDGDNHYKPFAAVYGTKTDDKQRPSLSLKPEMTDRDKKLKHMFVGGNFLRCCECGKRRVVFAAKKLNAVEQNKLTRVMEEQLYVCGNTLFPVSPLQDILVVRKGQNCHSTIETTYYSGVTTSLEAICSYCGSAENLAETEKNQDLQRNFGTVRPICHQCLASGKEPFTRNKRLKKK
ncbi:hypothetical protein MAR_018337 [Mya arenaria]|uniref:Uncharacterized protein n=1 Tax=Mya arenaria TaxID=6604 RepID=A0ABY7EH26_MYAAR|nr:hypothetical protein MAR_018337 [Mya arenaria]